jgi:hypothetical protein
MDLYQLAEETLTGKIRKSDYLDTQTQTDLHLLFDEMGDQPTL